MYNISVWDIKKKNKLKNYYYIMLHNWVCYSKLYFYSWTIYLYVSSSYVTVFL